MSGAAWRDGSAWTPEVVAAMDRLAQTVETRRPAGRPEESLYELRCETCGAPVANLERRYDALVQEANRRPDELVRYDSVLVLSWYRRFVANAAPEAERERLAAERLPTGTEPLDSAAAETVLATARQLTTMVARADSESWLAELAVPADAAADRIARRLPFRAAASPDLAGPLRDAADRLLFCADTLAGETGERLEWLAGYCLVLAGELHMNDVDPGWPQQAEQLSKRPPWQAHEAVVAVAGAGAVERHEPLAEVWLGGRYVPRWEHPDVRGVVCRRGHTAGRLDVAALLALAA